MNNKTITFTIDTGKTTLTPEERMEFVTEVSDYAAYVFREIKERRKHEENNDIVQDTMKQFYD